MTSTNYFLLVLAALGLTTQSPAVFAADLSFKFSGQCYKVDLEQEPGQGLSCTQPNPLKYVIIKCEDQSVVEKGTTKGAVQCEWNKRMNLKFKTKEKALSMNLRVQREADGKKGTKAKYTVESYGMDPGHGAGLADAEVESLEAPKPAESPLKFNFSGFAWIEHERSRRFGYDVGSTSTPTQTAQPNFTSKTDQADQNNTNLMSNLTFELSKDQTKLTSVVELGEIMYGDSGSGGGEGARASNVFELRNFYLTQTLSDKFTANGGIMSVMSDPRGFVYNNFLPTVNLGFKNDRFDLMGWYGDGAHNRVGASKLRNQYLGFTGNTNIMTDVKATLYWIHQSRANDKMDDGNGTTVTGNSTYQWAGGTFDIDLFKPLSIQATGIYNWWNYKELSMGSVTGNAYLGDLKFNYLWAAPQVSFGLEGLMTPGSGDSSNSTSGNQIVTRRKNFVSPASVSYLMAIATSDGADDAPGTPKQSVIANLNQAEGLRVAVWSTSVNFTSKFTGYLKYGYLMTESENLTTKSKDLGMEYDLGGYYQLTPSTLFQVDLASFEPGKFYTNREPAQLGAAKLKFNF